MPRRQDVRTFAIIAHVDHGKTTLVDAMFRQTGQHTEARAQALDVNDLERERGITILSKCTSVRYKGTTLNIVDTPGHADFGSEVERILRMVDGVLLLVDAVEGPMPQTKFVTQKALELGLAPIVVINKMDRPHIDPEGTLDQVFDLFADLGATDEQLDFPIIYGSAKQGWMSRESATAGESLKPLFETILDNVPAPEGDPDQPLQLQVTMLDYSSYIGRIGIGRVRNGRIVKGGSIVRILPDGSIIPAKVTRLQAFVGLGREDRAEAVAGDIVAVAGLEGIEIGETIADPESPKALPALSIDEPTLEMEFRVNNSPFAGRDGRYLTSRHLADRLDRELQHNVGLRIEPLAGEGVWKVSGRGELHLSILIETMRREGYELAVGRPQVIFKRLEGRLCEPTEGLVLDIDEAYRGPVIESLGKRQADMENMAPHRQGRLRLEYEIPARNLLGFRNQLMTMTRGTGIMHHSFRGWAPKGPDLGGRKSGAMIAKELGRTTAYALYNLQERGVLFLGAGVDVYEGQICGEHSRENDAVVNPCKTKHLSNIRSKASDEALTITSPRAMTLEEAIEFIAEDELVEVTPKALRLRKRVLPKGMRRRSEKSSRTESIED
ncbi:MAG: translational GTPase TypA [Elusimicrobiota bacterium]